MLLEKLLKKGREDACTEILVHILNKDDDSNRAFISEIIKHCACPSHDFSGEWTTQKTIKTTNHTSAYIDAYYESSDLIIAIESKFGAKFTDNQPHEYLQHLQDQTTPGKVGILILMAPTIRQNELIATVIKKTSDSTAYAITVGADGRFTCASKSVFFDFLSWDNACELLDPLHQPEIYIKAELESLIMRAIGDQTPFHCNDFNPHIAQTIRRIITLVKKVSKHLEPDIKTSTRKSETYSGFYFEKHGKNYWFGYSSYAWSQLTKTPLVFKIENKSLIPAFKSKYKHIMCGASSEYIPVPIPCDMTLDNAAIDCANRVLEILDSAPTK